jgi:hypothetical protein
MAAQAGLGPCFMSGPSQWGQVESGGLRRPAQRSHSGDPHSWQVKYTMAHASGSARAVGLPPGTMETDMRRPHLRPVHARTIDVARVARRIPGSC